MGGTKELTDKVLSRSGVILVLGEIGKEVLDIGGEIRDRAGCDEGVHFHRAVEAVEKLPGAAADCDHALRGADGVDVVSSQPIGAVSIVTKHVRLIGGYLPDHELVVSAAGSVVDVLGGKEIISNVASDIGGVIGPVCLGLQICKLTHRLFGK